ncbi:NAD-dependent epimerase/dehydratase family protein [Nocardia xishanensis]|uniref:NAD-dependent epimerase/dehydratase family protein n=1 Tax=Nocardia xishanensis TaxID=238964 RepID=UPI000A050227|nr:NAD-dependent epimerase/dehydratase family protein [Nocardia xishanensis]
MTMKVLLTGATGFLGRRVVHRLAAEGHEVSALVRGTGRRIPHATVVPGSLEDVEAWEDRLAGIDVVVHAAGLVSTWAPRRALDEAIVDGTRDVLTAAVRHGVRRFVYISSESVLQDGRPLLDITESQPTPALPSSRYGQAKLAAEHLIRAHADAIETIVLRPTFIWGPGSGQLADLAARARAGKLPLIDQGRASFEHVHVDNVAAAVAAALHEGAPGGTYLITNGEPMPVREFLAGVLAAHSAPMPTRSVPSGPLFALARAGEWLWSTLPLPGRPPLTRFEVEFLALPRRYDITRARNELKYEPAVGFAEGIAGLDETPEAV